jgi:hypothetical protein
MNHQPFETWLLEDVPLKTEQQRELQAHLHMCPACSAIAEANLALRSARLAAPLDGFTARFERRLLTHRREQRARQRIGGILFTLGGLALLLWLAGPLLMGFMRSPAQWITMAVGYVLFLVTFAQTLAEAGRVLLHVVPEFVTPFGWMIAFSTLAGLGLLWSISIWRFTRRPQGV